MKPRAVEIGKIKVGAGNGLTMIAGPCVIETRTRTLELAKRLADLADKAEVDLIFKASYDKANRSSITSFRGPGLLRGLEILAEVREKTGLPVLTDIHSEDQAMPASKAVDVLQIPAFLCRQTDILVAAGETGLPVNIKKGQFLAPWDIAYAAIKVESTGNRRILLTERGTLFGYSNLVVDMRSLALMKKLGYPVVFDATHSVQKPGGAGSVSTGDVEMAPVLARAAVAAGCDAVFTEVQIRRGTALSDADNSLEIKTILKFWKQLVKIKKAAC